MRKSVFITGVAGFIGSYVARHFAEKGFEVVGIDSRLTEDTSGHLFRFYQCTLPSEDLGHFIEQVRPQVCIHCAGPASVDLSMVNPAIDFNASLPPTFNLLESLRHYAPECRLVYLSSAAVYGNPETLPIRETQCPNPISPYGFHKLICESLCLEFSKVYGLPTTVVRIFSAYGIGLKRQVLWDICQKVLTQSVLKLRGTGYESRDFINVKDVGEAIYLISQKASWKAETYNLASGVETTVKALADIILANLGRPLPVEFDGTITPGTPLHWKADISRLTEVGFTPEINLEMGVRAYAQWCKRELFGI
jgi:UDP-glucose 4-epimerase